jgi:hypothetical protein
VGRYQERLRAKKGVVGDPTKLAKPGSGGFVGDRGCPVFENEGLASAAYQATSAEPDGAACKVEIIELPQAQRYRKTFAALQMKPPALVDVARWRQCVEDGKRFLAKWGEQAEALGWDSRDLFGLHTPLDKPHPSYRRLSRYDCTGLIWLLEGRPVVALTADTAAIENATGNINTYRRFNKPALGPLGDSLDDFK